MIDYARLASEITTDPRGYGYAALVAIGSDAGVADLLNLVRNGAPGTVPTTPTADGGSADGIIRIKRDDIQPAEVFHAIALADLINNPGASQLEWFNALLHATFDIRLVDASGQDTPVAANVKALVRAGTPTLARLQALATRVGSRAEELFGPRTVLTHLDVAKALGRG